MTRPLRDDERQLIRRRLKLARDVFLISVPILLLIYFGMWYAPHPTGDRYPWYYDVLGFIFGVYIFLVPFLNFIFFARLGSAISGKVMLIVGLFFLFHIVGFGMMYIFPVVQSVNLLFCIIVLDWRAGKALKA